MGKVSHRIMYLNILSIDIGTVWGGEPLVPSTSGSCQVCASQYSYDEPCHTFPPPHLPYHVHSAFLHAVASLTHVVTELRKVTHRCATQLYLLRWWFRSFQRIGNIVQPSVDHVFIIYKGFLATADPVY